MYFHQEKKIIIKLTNFKTLVLSPRTFLGTAFPNKNLIRLCFVIYYKQTAKGHSTSVTEW